MKILVVESHEIKREGLSALVRAHFAGAVVYTARNGLDAMAAAKEVSLDLAIVSTELPKMSGIELAKRLLSAHAELRLVLLATHGGTSLVEQAFQAGASGYMLSHDHPDDLKAGLDTVLKGKKHISEKGRGNLDVSALKMGDNSHTNVLESLTKRQLQVLALIASGLSVREIASATNLAPKTVDAHRRSASERLGVDTTAELTRIALQEGLIDFDGNVQADRTGERK